MAAASTDPVLQTFRRKFVIITMSFVTLLLISMLAVTSYMTFRQHVQETYDALHDRSERMASLPAEMLIGDMQVMREWGMDVELNLGQDDTSNTGRLYGSGLGGNGNKDGRNKGEPRDAAGDPLVPTSAYLVDTEGDIQVIVSDSLELDEATVKEAIEDILDDMELDDASTATGKIGVLDLYYEIRELRNGYSVALASGNHVSRTMRALHNTLGLIEIIAFALLFVLTLFLSRWITRPVERAWQQQRQFIADASHELKTPLSVIRANDSLLMADPSASVASQMQWIESTETEATIMQDLVNDMLFLAQSENTENELVQSEVDFSHVVEGAVLQFESVAFERGVLIDPSVAPDVKMMGEEKSLNRLVGTLVDNACKYAQDGGTVTVRLERLGGQCRLSVNNTGEPIPEEDLPHLFDRFYRSDKARTREQGGFGLGLAIAKSIVDEHKGSIAVASSALEGTTFTVVLPAL